MVSSATSLKIDQKREGGREKKTICRLEKVWFCSFTFSPSEATGRFHPSVRIGEAPLLSQNSAAAAASSLTELRMGALAANVSSFFTAASPHFRANQKEAANTSQEHHTMINNNTAVTRNLINTYLLEILRILRKAKCKYYIRQKGANKY